MVKGKDFEEDGYTLEKEMPDTGLEKWVNREDEKVLLYEPEMGSIVYKDEI